MARDRDPVTLVRAGHVVTIAPELGNLTDGAVAIRGARIAEVGRWSDLAAHYPGAAVVGDGDGILIPGLVNAHTHLSEALFPSITDRMNLFEWLAAVVVPAGRLMTRRAAYMGALLKGCEMLKSGVTALSDMFVHYNPGSQASLGVVDALAELGMRGMVSLGAEDLYTPGTEPEQYVEEHTALRERAGSTELVGFSVGIGTLGGQSEKLLKASVQLAADWQVPIHTHLAEVREEVTEFRTRHGVSPVEYAARLGMLELPLIAAHCIWLTESDLDLLVTSQTRFAHNPVANMYLGSGVFQSPRLLRSGAVVALGTDGAASNNNQNMFQVMKTAALLQKLVRMDAAALDATAVMSMATAHGARALGLEGPGIIAAGRPADLVLLDGHEPTIVPVHDPVLQLVYAATGREVSHVWVAGRMVVQDGRVTTVDEAAVVEEASALARELVSSSPELSMVLRAAGTLAR